MTEMLYMARRRMIEALVEIDKAIVVETNRQFAEQNAAATDGRIMMPIDGPAVEVDDAYIPNPFAKMSVPDDTFTEGDGHLLEAADQIGGMVYLNADITLLGFTRSGFLTFLNAVLKRAS